MTEPVWILKRDVSVGDGSVAEIVVGVMAFGLQAAQTISAAAKAAAQRRAPDSSGAFAKAAFGSGKDTLNILAEAH